VKKPAGGETSKNGWSKYKEELAKYNEQGKERDQGKDGKQSAVKNGCGAHNVPTVRRKEL
jgi:hypothetical protein